MHSSRFLVLLAILTVMACTGPSEGCADPYASVQFSVSLRSKPGPPLLSWEPACAVSTIVVNKQTGATWSLAWHVSVEEAWPSLTPPVHYGQLFPGAFQVLAIPHLEAGATYSVRLERMLEGDLLLGQGFGTFVYRP